MFEDRVTNIAVVGYGNVGKGVISSIGKNRELYDDVLLAGIISRRPEMVKSQLVDNFSKEDYVSTRSGSLPKVLSASEPERWGELRADVYILCGGSKEDLPIQGPAFAQIGNTVDSFDNHDRIPPWRDGEGRRHLGYFHTMNNTATANGNVSIISAGWDPGTFSDARVCGNAFLPGSKPYAFYGLSSEGGLSQGHSDAIRKIKGVKDARQYTHTIHENLERVRMGENPDLAVGERHWRECVVVLEKDTVDESLRVSEEIRKMESYFEPYPNVQVTFVTQKELDRNYSKMPHDGVVVTSGTTGKDNRASIEYKNNWASNPEATAGILVACARAAHRLSLENKVGAFTMLDLSAAQLSPHSRETLLEKFM